MSTTESFQARLVKAKAAVSGVAKDGRNSQQNYNFASVESMLRAVRGPLAEQGIGLSVSLDNIHRDIITSGRGAQGERITATVEFTLRDTLSDEHTTHRWAGVGEDYGDKAIGKAYTSAVKTFIRTEWLLPTGDDPEANQHVPTVELPQHAKPVGTDALTSLGAVLVPHIGRDVAQALVRDLRRANGGELSAGQVIALKSFADYLPLETTPEPDGPVTAEEIAEKLDATEVVA